MCGYGFYEAEEDYNDILTSSHHRQHTLEITSQVSALAQVRLQS